MSDSQNVYRECSDCGRIAFEPKHCEICVAAYPHSGGQMEYCADCRIECNTCHQFVCEEHGTNGTCDGCREPAEPDMNTDNAPSESSYRVAMIDAGRGGLLR